jgi:hypothetical protein
MELDYLDAIEKQRLEDEMGEDDTNDDEYNGEEEEDFAQDNIIEREDDEI